MFSVNNLHNKSEIPLLTAAAVSETKSNINDDPAVFIWWTNFIGDFDHTKICGDKKCFFTENRDYLTSANLKGFLFYGSNMNTTNFPIPRNSNHLWGLLHEESPKNIPFIMFDPMLSHFNYTSTFSRYSDLPLTVQYLESTELLTSNKYLVPLEEKNRFQKEENLAPVLYMQSICNTISNRDNFVLELQKYIKVDSYGGCLNNKKLPDNLSTNYISTISSDALYHFIARYKFVIAYENGICDDYITEKLWRPLIVGIVPVYFGSPSVEDWLPNKNSAILIKNYENPKKLAEFIKFLNDNDSEYLKHLEHKYNKLNPIKNYKLVNAIYNLTQGKEFEMIESFECLLCKNIDKDKIQFATKEHYNCDLEFKYSNFSTEWNDSFRQGKCEAKIITEMISKNFKLSDHEFFAKIIKYFENGSC